MRGVSGSFEGPPLFQLCVTDVGTVTSKLFSLAGKETMVDASTSLFATTIAPAMGAVLSNIMWATPILDIRQQRKLRSLGSINPAPYVVGMYCTYGWLLYGSLKHDGFIMWANFVAVGAMTYCNQSLVALSLSDINRIEDSIKEDAVSVNKISSVEVNMVALGAKQATLFYVETGLWLAPLLWGFMSWLGWAVWSSGSDNDHIIEVVGWVCMACQVIFFFAPLLIMREVIRLGGTDIIERTLRVLNCPYPHVLFT